MVFQGIGRVFSTVNSEQFDTIGAFWDELSARYGVGNLRGLGYDWTDDSITYVIGLNEGVIEGADREVLLPEDGWTVVKGKTSDLEAIYDGIYRDGPLTYEIETFSEDGSCEIAYRR